ncbi:hypothetical protein GCM10009592_28820 [Brachybacterium rhamnosum]|uniref:Uncharacterized protein n=1 Tax=Brachybacterium rhamnosum TaxID=173361 RepID=A0ABW4Q414_9MICO
MAWKKKTGSTVRDLTPLIVEGWTPGTATARRSGDVVLIDVQALGRPAAGTGVVQILSLPVGYRPAANVYGRTFRGSLTRCLTGGALSIDAPTSSVDYLHFTFLTSDPRSAA